MVRLSLPKTTWTRGVAVVLVVAATAFELFKLNLVSPEKPLSQFDLGLIDTVTFFLGGVGLLLVGAAISDAQRERARAPHGKSAFQRAIELYQALYRFVGTVDRQQEVLEQMAVKSNNKVSIDVVRMAFDTIRTQVSEQVLTASHAMDDWKSEFPSVVAEIEDEARAAHQVSPFVSTATATGSLGDLFSDTNGESDTGVGSSR